MKQKQRGSDKHKTRVKLTVKAKEIKIKGKKFDLEPLVEKTKKEIDVFSQIADNVEDIMGVSCLPKETEVRLFDENEYKIAMEEMGCEEREGQIVGFYLPGRKDVIVNFERGARDLVENGWKPKPAMADSLILCSAHELAHLNHYFYDAGIMEKRDELAESMHSDDRIKDFIALGKEGKLESLKGYLAYIRSLPIFVTKYFFSISKYRGLTEGIATWTEFEISKRFIGHETFRFSKVDVNDDYSFGYNFVKKVSESTDKNPVKLVMDHNPTYVEMLYPQLYILRMKASLLI